MYAQIITLSLKPDKVDEVVKLYQDYINPEIRSSRGYRGFSLLLDREKSKAVSVTVWDDRAAAESSEEAHLYLEQRAGYPLYSAPPVREGFEVAIQNA